MPLLTVQTNVPDDKITDEFIKQLSAKVGKVMGKPEKFMAVQISGGQKLFFGGSNEPAALMELVSIGLSSDQTANLSKEIMGLFEEKLQIQPERIYIQFTEVAKNMLGWNNGTF